eukprot:8603638-Pyramimonas_sp.AAC.1
MDELQCYEHLLLLLDELLMDGRAPQVQSGEFKVQGGEFKVQGGEFKVQGGEFKVQGGEFK